MPTLPTSVRGYVDDVAFDALLADALETVPELTWPTSVQTYAAMRRDTQLAALIGGYTLQLRRASWQLDGRDCRPAVVNLVADDFGLPVAGAEEHGAARTRGVSWSEHLRTALGMLTYGHCGFEMQANVTSGQARLVGLWDRPQWTINHLHVDGTSGALKGVTQDAPWREDAPQITADRLVWYAHEREGAGWYGTSLLRPAYGPWLIKREMQRVLATSNRRFGMGVPTVEWAAGTNPTPAQHTDALNAASAARVGDQSGLAMPPGARLVLTGLSGGAPDTLAFLKWLDQQMSRMALMSHLDLGQTETGSRALGESFIDLWFLALESIGEHLADVATRQVAARIVDWNWGPDEPVPRVTVSGIGSRREVTAESLDLLLRSGGLSADPALEAWIRREYRLPERSPSAPVPAARTAPPAPVAAKPAVRPRGRRRQQPGQMSLFNAADPEPDAAAVQAAWEEALQQALARWPAEAQPMVDDLVAQVQDAVEAEDLAALGTLTVGAGVVGALATVVAGWAAAIATAAVAQVIAEAATQGVAITVPDDVGADRASAVAEAIVGVIAAGYATGAARTALLHAGPDADPQVVADAVRAHLDELSTTGRGWVADNLGACLSAGQNAGRFAAFDAADPTPTRYRAVETNDTNTCQPCKDLDGTEFASASEATAAYPTGGYWDCQGRLRCRGFPFPIWT